MNGLIHDLVPIWFSLVWLYLGTGTRTLSFLATLTHTNGIIITPQRGPTEATCGIGNTRRCPEDHRSALQDRTWHFRDPACAHGSEAARQRHPYPGPCPGHAALKGTAPQVTRNEFGGIPALEKYPFNVPMWLGVQRCAALHLPRRQNNFLAD